MYLSCTHVKILWRKCHLGADGCRRIRAKKRSWHRSSHGLFSCFPGCTWILATYWLTIADGGVDCRDGWYGQGTCTIFTCASHYGALSALCCCADSSRVRVTRDIHDASENGCIDVRIHVFIIHPSIIHSPVIHPSINPQAGC